MPVPGVQNPALPSLPIPPASTPTGGGDELEHATKIVTTQIVPVILRIASSTVEAVALPTGKPAGRVDGRVATPRTSDDPASAGPSIDYPRASTE